MEGTRDENGICDINASCDGTWQKRGYNSMNVIETVISSDLGKRIVHRVRTKNCKLSQTWEGRED